ncbi:MAG: helix-turn-helix domain-containing protein [Candidatus Gastranaerophilales bacterium]
MNFDIEKLKQCTIPHDEIVKKILMDPEAQQEYLNVAIEEFIEDGDYNEFYRCLEQVIKARESISSFAKKVNIDRSNLYSMFRGKKVPRLDTIGRILKELGYSIRIA